MPEHIIARVELLNASTINYEVLHKAMKAIGFSQVIPVDDKLWKLPRGTYFSDEPDPMNLACDIVTEAAIAVDPKVMVVVTWGECKFFGLPESHQY